MKYLINKLTTDLILNMFQERLWGTVVINNSHASFLQMKVQNINNRTSPYKLSSIC